MECFSVKIYLKTSLCVLHSKYYFIGVASSSLLIETLLAAISRCDAICIVLFVFFLTYISFVFFFIHFTQYMLLFVHFNKCIITLAEKTVGHRRNVYIFWPLLKGLLEGKEQNRILANAHSKKKPVNWQCLIIITGESIVYCRLVLSSNCDFSPRVWTRHNCLNLSSVLTKKFVFHKTELIILLLYIRNVYHTVLSSYYNYIILFLALRRNSIKFLTLRTVFLIQLTIYYDRVKTYKKRAKYKLNWLINTQFMNYCGN